VTRNESSPRFWCRSPTVSAAISARCNPTCGATERIARSRSPAIVSSGGALGILRACALEKASVAPSSRSRRPLHLADGIPRGVAVADQVFIERRQRREAPANGRGRRALGLAHEALPCDHPLVVRLAQLSPRRDRQRPHEVLHVEPVGAARALLAPARFVLRGYRRAAGASTPGTGRGRSQRWPTQTAQIRGATGLRDNGGAARRQHRPLRCASYPRRPGCFGLSPYESSNPSPSSGESAANLTSEGVAGQQISVGDRCEGYSSR
jgi:hypothetical protein